MAWQLGLNEYETQMKNKKNRIENANKFISDIRYNSIIRKIVQETLLQSEKPMNIADIH